MSSMNDKHTMILGAVAVCLIMTAVIMSYNKSSPEPLGMPRNLAGRLNDLKRRFNDWNNQRKAKNAKALRKKMNVGARRARVDPNLDCSKVRPSDPNWARCSQGAGVGRVPTMNAKNAVSSTILEFEKDSIKHQGLGSRLQDAFVQDQFESDARTNLGSSGLGGMRIDPSNLKNNAFFSQGTENPTMMVTSGLNSKNAAAFPFSTRSDEDKDGGIAPPSSTGPVSQTEPVGMGMSMEEFTKGVRVDKDKMRKLNRPMGKREIIDDKGRGASRHEFNSKPSDEAVGSAFNPFVDSPSKDLGSGLMLNEAFEPKLLGSAGSRLEDAFQNTLGTAVSPISSNVGVSPEEISAATAILEDVNIVQSTTGGQLNFGIRP